jgi:mannose-6-phosphate isomerase-like protein (cupin superfamily)
LRAAGYVWTYEEEVRVCRSALSARHDLSVSLISEARVMSNTSPELRHALTYALRAAVPLDLDRTRQRLESSGGGLEIVHVPPGLEIRVEVLCSPGPGEIRVETGDALYVVLDGSGILGVEDGAPLSLGRGEAAFVPAGARHVLFGNPQLSLLVVSAPRWGVRAAR